LVRSATTIRPRESIAMLCGRLNSPGPDPRVPQALMNFPSLENFTMRLTGPSMWPSATKMSPF
jgi:hypothetical protein